MSPYAKFGLDQPSRSAGHRQQTNKQTDKQTYRLLLCRLSLRVLYGTAQRQFTVLGSLN